MRKSFVLFALSFLFFEVGSWMLCQAIVITGSWNATTWWMNVNGWHFCIVSGILAFVGCIMAMEGK
jgi:hypothetical protein